MKGALRFTPNRKTHPEFADALKSAAELGVNILALDCEVSEDGMVISEEIKEIVI
jgi:sugar fermentation stimulation protein A